MTHEEFLNRLNLTPERLAHMQELAKSLESFDQSLKEASPTSHATLASGLKGSKNDSLDMIARAVPELSRKEIEDRLNAALQRKIHVGSSDTSFMTILPNL